MTNVFKLPAPVERRFAPTANPRYPNGVPYTVPAGTPCDAPLYVSEAALLARINRALSREDASRMCRNREDSRAFLDLGRFYILNDRNCATATHCDLEEVAREMALLRPGEKLRSAPC